jgi:hypothetical protein
MIRALLRNALLILSLSVIAGDALAMPAMSGGCTPLITPQYGQCNTADLQHIFSGYVCQYETIVADIFSQVYCTVRKETQLPLQLLLTLFVAIFGAAIAIGAVPFTQKDVALAVFRIALLAGFVMQGEFIVTHLYRGVIGFITSGVDVVMSAAGGGTGRSIYERIDDTINLFTGSASQAASRAADDPNRCNDSILPLLITLLFVVPPMFFIGVAVIFRILLSFLRALVGYLFGITCIMFLTVVSPIFLGAGLFQATRELFTKWLQYMMSFAIQVVVVFAFIGLILSMGIFEDIASLRTISVPYTGGTWQESSRVNFNACTICTEPRGNGTRFDGCTDPTPVPPTGATSFLNILRLLAIESLNLVLLAFLIDAVMKLAPQVAQELGGSRAAPSVSGTMFDSITGMRSLTSLGSNAGRAFAQGRGSIPGRAQGSVSAGYTALFRGTQQNPGGIIGEFIEGALGGRPR